MHLGIIKITYNRAAQPRCYQNAFYGRPFREPRRGGNSDLLWQSGASESATVCFVISLSICYWLWFWFAIKCRVLRVVCVCIGGQTTQSGTKQHGVKEFAPTRQRREDVFASATETDSAARSCKLISPADQLTAQRSSPSLQNKDPGGGVGSTSRGWRW